MVNLGYYFYPAVLRELVLLIIAVGMRRTIRPDEHSIPTNTFLPQQFRYGLCSFEREALVIGIGAQAAGMSVYMDLQMRILLHHRSH